MQERAAAKELIQTLEEREFYAECPCCNEPVRLRDCELFYLDDFTSSAKEAYDAMMADIAERTLELKKRRTAISSRSEVGAKAVNLGFIFERLAPAMEQFHFDRSDCRSLFDPIDYVIFEGLSSRGSVSKIIFSDIKTGKARLQSRQQDIKELVKAKKVSMMTYESEGTNGNG
jgi:predicted Holliday junction resolvase-like endonuclease